MFFAADITSPVHSRPDTNISFLVDTGSGVSLIPANTYQKRNSLQQTLFAANSSTINVYGQKTLSLNFNLRRDFLWTFQIADVSIPILGADFLHYFELVPDLRNKCLRDTKTKLQSVGHLKYADLHSVQISISKDTIYHKLLKEFPSITKLPNPNQPVKHTTVHHIVTKGPSVVAKYRRLDPDRLKIAKSEFRNMMHLGHLRPSKSNYSSPLHLVPKKGIRTAVKEDLQSSCSELVYGATLRLPCDMTDVSNIPPCDIEFITDLRHRMQQLNPVATSTHCTDRFYIHPSLKSSSHIFLRVDRVQPPLRQPYTGPHKVLRRTDKTITVDINGRKTTVSLDRVKPAHLLSETVLSPPPVIKNLKSTDVHTSKNDEPPTYVTRSGRRVHFPKKLTTYITFFLSCLFIFIYGCVFLKQMLYFCVVPSYYPLSLGDTL
ncbi:hypothetical protein AVEN_213061-1 [Araneus ventricosus]|uniref:Peptidase A2 domain-containing protein n=1 Tax=Araneus ventricosus TaxID=182803 RepID=A0A4Y2VL18_ARAVE|nr:hypothetical protein AVEN_213061-1 [Araneus ventricosus]